MHTLVALLLAAAAACAIARPPRPTAPPPVAPQLQLMESEQPETRYLPQFVESKVVINPYLTYRERTLGLLGSPPDSDDWADLDLYRMKQRQEDYGLNPEEAEYLGLLPSNENLISRLYEDLQDQVDYDAEPIKYTDNIKSLLYPDSREYIPKLKDTEGFPVVPPFHFVPKNENKKLFALTPSDAGYFDSEETTEEKTVLVAPKLSEMPSPQQIEEPVAAMVLEPPRQTRQNPNLSKQKHLVPDTDKLNTGMYNLGGTHEMSHHHSSVDSSAAMAETADSIYGVALIAAVGAALTMTVVGFAFGLYTLSKKAKAAADVDYPAYGVTGPTVDCSGDRKLAHSAHMYHYQHQKQQIIAMERNGLEQRLGSVSDPESEEENEEGDYTVYECPGFATTGAMEVKNPMFSEEPTPATPGKVEVVKAQPKD